MVKLLQGASSTRLSISVLRCNKVAFFRRRVTKFQYGFWEEA